MLHPTRLVRLIALACAVALAATACGDDTAGDLPAGGGDVPITSRAVAAVAFEHVPLTSDAGATWTGRDDTPGTVGADLRYDADGEYDGDLLSVVVAPADGDAPACEPDDPQCEAREVDGGTLLLAWDEVAPEEDPGYVAVAMDRGDEVVSVLLAGDEITGDPREQDLRFSVETLEELAQDERLGLTTSQAVVDAGEELEDWTGGEQDPTRFDRVPATDTATSHAYFLTRGGYLDYTQPVPSQVRDELGPGAIGSRFTQDGRPALVVDVLVVEGRPAWLRGDPCADGRFGSCQRAGEGRRGPLYLMWRPGPESSGGVVWAVGLRRDETVAVRMSGFEVPASLTEVKSDIEWSVIVSRVLSSGRLGTTTTREVVDFVLQTEE
ncbi:hypothetical protein [Nocardioides ferulae]|uniref:hypothetical protein n=1 Tax=Nocardioides ferulae TaxID=2340821 RepID=UPI000EB58A83|nr:hypothetical protein [Nocardioides ferulae]